MSDKNMSLMQLFRENCGTLDAVRIKEQSKFLADDTRKLNSTASEYTNRYQQEIEEGTRQRQLLIENGANRGMSEEDALKSYCKFIPTKYTPILNMLHFMFREASYIDEVQTKRDNKLYGHLTEDHDVNSSGNFTKMKDMDEVIYGNITHKQFQTIKKLKTLALGDKCNANESAVAFSLCKELCRKFNLEFDKIPTNN
jgi:hypothetical protein